MKARDIKTINVLTLTWFDKVNGNTYFAQKITINRDRKSEKVLFNRFQYGYSSFDNFALKYVMEALNLKTDLRSYDNYKKIRFYNEVVRGCKKKELTHISER